jgi:hypothetical protein
MQTDSCRLCGGRALRQFSRRVLGKYDIAYYQCSACHSLQSQEPYWLEAAYKHNFAVLDTGAVQRNLTNLGAVALVARLYGLKNMLDFGGGDGLLCRLLRDYGFNCYVSDKYANTSYAQGFTEQDFDKPDIVLAFEVVEHFARPAEDLAALFSPRPALVLLSTELFNGQDESWWYLTPETGQHIFFYSRAAMQLIAERYGYVALVSGSYILFVEKARAGGIRASLARVLLNRLVIRLARTLLVAGPSPGRDRDFEALTLRLQREEREAALPREGGP